MEVLVKQLSIQMPVVSQCSVSDCAYNTNNGCHARAITVGDTVRPGCDTYFSMPGSTHSKAGQRTAGVGACKVSSCQFNEDFECVAEEIAVGHASNEINCLTYQSR